MLVSSVTVGFVSSCDENVQDLLSRQLSFTQYGHISRSRHAAHYILETVDDEKLVPLSPLHTFTPPPIPGSHQSALCICEFGRFEGCFLLGFFFLIPHMREIIHYVFV